MTTVKTTTLQPATGGQQPSARSQQPTTITWHSRSHHLAQPQPSPGTASAITWHSTWHSSSQHLAQPQPSPGAAAAITWHSRSHRLAQPQPSPGAAATLHHKLCVGTGLPCNRSFSILRVSTPVLRTFDDSPRDASARAQLLHACRRRPDGTALHAPRRNGPAQAHGRTLCFAQSGTTGLASQARRRDGAAMHDSPRSMHLPPTVGAPFQGGAGNDIAATPLQMLRHHRRSLHHSCPLSRGHGGAA